MPFPPRLLLVLVAIALVAQPVVMESATKPSFLGLASEFAGPAAPVAHAGADQTIDGAVTVTLDGTASWDADDDPLTFAWTQIEGPLVALDLSDPAHPAFTAPLPGGGGLAAENQVVAFRLVVSDGTNASAPSDVRITVLKPFAPANDAFAVVTTTACTDASGGYAAGSYGAALSYAVTHPGTRVTFNLPASDPGYNAAGGFWQFPPCHLPLLRYSTNPASPLNANGTTIDGWSQTANAQAAGVFVNTAGPSIFVPGMILEVSHWSDPLPPSRIVIRGLAQEMSISNANHLVLSGNHYNVMPDGLSQARGAGEHVSFSSGGTTCGRLGIGAGTHIRVGGATAAERNLFGGGCPMFSTSPANGRPPIAGLKVIGNYFGVDRTGTRSILDQNAPGFGVQITGTRELAPIDAQFGGVEPGAGNLVSGFGPETALLVSLGAGGDRIVMLGNRIGTDASGTAAIANREGVVLQQMSETGAGPEWIVGGPEPGAGNLISGSTGAGIYIDNQSGSDGGWRMRIQGNAIGTSADGLAAIPNQVGVRAETAGGETLIGGAGRGEGNTVSGNRDNGLYLDSYPDGVTPARVLGNQIGVGRDGVTPLGNGRHGITSWLYAQAVSVGGVGPGEGNVIAFNGGNGYAIETCCGAAPRRGTVRGNSIHHNGGIGIALSNFTTPTPNNPGDAPDGPNDRRNHPVLASAASGAGGTTITGTLDTIAGLSVMLDFYANTPDASNANEGERYLGSHSFVAAAGATPFTAVLPDVVLPAGTFVTSTTTDAEGNTSEFGGGIEVTANAKAPSVTVVTCENAVYNGVPHTTCTASVTGEGGLNQALPVSYTDNVNAGTATGSATFAGDDDYEASSDSTTFEIAKAPSVTAVACANVIYNASEQTPCTASATGVGGLDHTLSVSYADNVNAGTASASASYAGDANHEESSASTTFEIAKAPSVTVVTCADVIYNGAAQTPCTADVTGIGGLDQAVPVSYADNVNVGTASASASYAGDSNHESSSASTTFAITPAALTVSAVNASRHFGLPNPVFTASFSGFVADETPAILGGALIFTTSATIDSPVGSYDVFPSGLTSTNYAITFVKGKLEITNTAPLCNAAPSIGALWPPNHRIVPIDIVGVTDPDGDAVAIHVDRILQDEPTNTTGDGNTTVDGGVLDGATRVWVRAERSGTPRVPGDGRVYEILFTATDAGGARCTGVVTVGVPHDMGRPIAVDSGVRYDSTTGARVP